MKGGGVSPLTSLLTGLASGLSDGADDNSLFRIGVALGTLLTRPITIDVARSGAAQLWEVLGRWASLTSRELPSKLREALEDVGRVGAAVKGIGKAAGRIRRLV